MNKSKINKYKINNNNKTNTKHEFNVKYERYDINKILAKTHFKCKKKKSEKNLHFCNNMSPCHAFTSPSCSLMEKSSLPIFCKCGEPWLLVFLYLIAAYASVRQCVIIICRCPQNIIEISLSRKNVHRSMLSKMPEI